MSAEDRAAPAGVPPADAVAAWLGVSSDRLEGVASDVVAQVARELERPEMGGGLVEASRRLAAELAGTTAAEEVGVGVATAGAVVSRLDIELERCERYGRVVAVIVLDVTTPVTVVGAEGPGRALGGALAERLRSLLRTSDLLGRVDARGFVVVCPETDRIAADQLATRLVDAVGQRPLLTASGALPVSVRAGVAASSGGDGGTVLIASALEELRAG